MPTALFWGSRYMTFIRRSVERLGSPLISSDLEPIFQSNIPKTAARFEG
jgi:hypothetical protein